MSFLHNAARTTRTLRTPIARLAPSASSLNATLRTVQRQSRAMASFTPSPSHQEPESSSEDLRRIREAAEERRQYYKRRTIYNGIGFVCGMIGIWVVATQVELPTKPTKMDSGKGYHDSRLDDPQIQLGKERKAVVQRLGEEAEENTDVVETGTSSVPTFPRLLQFDDLKTGEGATTAEELAATEYQLMGLGLRTVSFLGIEVYVVGMYVATDDIAKLQHVMVRKIDPIATTLVAGEKENLKEKLLDPVIGEDVWNHVLQTAGVRTLIRITPTRNTDFGHMRDAYVRAVTAQAAKRNGEWNDDQFGASVNKLKTMFGKGKVPKGKELVLARNEKGTLCAWFDDGKNGPQRLGQVEDERISRALWLHYLAGKHVASEPARKSIVNGLMEFVERPVGTVATQVHV